eukprot:TRINITY_DN1626_c1_g1_i1.p1 TRINITY_DN1626_c1_g1~~TRINITY_DN1626_c1_g1_i1.p1  ORF type:complete len:355 (-),score=101.27 TRINITY_DN1626_c1_g1_i1:1080-2144(-)
MLEKFVILTKGGICLWKYQTDHVTGQPINHLITTILLEERAGSDSYTEGQYILKWVLDNEFDLIFVAVYQSFLKLAYVEALLEDIKDLFIDTYQDTFDRYGRKQLKFDKKFQAKLNELENSKTSRPTSMRTFEETEKGKEIIQAKGPSETKTKEIKEKDPSEEDPSEESEEIDEWILQEEARRNKLKNRGGKGKNNNKNKGNNTGFGSTSDKKKNAGGKKNRSWVKEKADPGQLVYGPKSGGKSSGQDRVVNNFGATEATNLDFEVSSEESYESDSEEENTTKKRAGMFSFFSNLTNKELTMEDIEPVLVRFEDHLISKNVARESHTNLILRKKIPLKNELECFHSLAILLIKN